jgi:PilZ domain
MQQLQDFSAARRLPHHSRTGGFRQRERRRTTRFPCMLPLRLRLGADLFPGCAGDLSRGGMGLWFVPKPGAPHSLALALTSHERGALEVVLGEQRCVVRVRIVRSQPTPEGLNVGVAFTRGEEARRLIGWLEEHSVPARRGA